MKCFPFLLFIGLFHNTFKVVYQHNYFTCFCVCVWGSLSSMVNHRVKKYRFQNRLTRKIAKRIDAGSIPKIIDSAHSMAWWSWYGRLDLVPNFVWNSTKYNILDVSRWATPSLHLSAVELLDQPIRNIMNVYACNANMMEDRWGALAELDESLHGVTLLDRSYRIGRSLKGWSPDRVLSDCFGVCLSVCGLQVTVFDQGP